VPPCCRSAAVQRIQAGWLAGCLPGLQPGNGKAQLEVGEAGPLLFGLISCSLCGLLLVALGYIIDAQAPAA